MAMTNYQTIRELNCSAKFTQWRVEERYMASYFFSPSLTLVCPLQHFGGTLDLILVIRNKELLIRNKVMDT